MEFENETLKCQFQSDKKKLIIANHTTPFIDAIWMHSVMDIPHFIYMAHCMDYENDWIRAVKSPYFVKNESEYLQSLTSFCAILFPSGGAIDWKSGFYYLSKNTDAVVYLTTIDYCTRKITIVERYEPANYSWIEIKKECIEGIYSRVQTPIWSDFLHLFGYGDEAMINKKNR